VVFIRELPAWWRRITPFSVGSSAEALRQTMSTWAPQSASA
jgi:hypothetical protein